ncbi:TolC family protein [Roseomonas chloroacetimidivorans]|uniref:TolC family protein n=1 Tax=Roseomonas chloroacetimidivorans TaxID=1766656 RepID=UPI003C776134
MRFKFVWLAVSLAATPAIVLGQDARAQSGPVTINSPQQAVDTALARSSALRGAGAARQAVQADALQARLRPNPEASVTFENFGGVGGRGEYRGGRSVETTVGVAQRVELGGKRSARIGFAARSGDVAGLEYQGARLDLARDVITALADAEAASRLVAVERERARLAGETLRAARARVEAGREPPLQAQRAEVVRTTAEIAAERAQREVEISLAELAVLIGAPQVEIAPRQRWFEDVGPAPRPPVPADPLARLVGNPDLTRLDAAVAQQRANLSLQRATAVPDVTVQGQVRRFQDTGETAFVAGASIPLPFSDRNQGGIARAQAELLRAEAEADRGRAALAASLVAAEQRVASAWRSVQSLKRDAVPAAEQAARSASGGFAEGKFSFLEVLDAQRALSDARAQLIDAYREFHTRRAAADRLRGNLPSSQTNGSAR